MAPASRNENETEMHSVERAMILAAGMGSRMRPVTDVTPKPLVPVAGRPVLDRVIAHLQAAGVGSLVVNLHHRGTQIRQHLEAMPQGFQVQFSDESEQLLDTGGGVAKALPLLGSAPFFVINADAFWIDGDAPILTAMARNFDAEKMHALLLLQPKAHATAYDGAGDYFLQSDGQLQRRQGGDAAPYVFTGMQILSPALFQQSDKGVFSLVRLYDRAQQQGKLFGMPHEGQWVALNTLDAVAAAERLLSGEAQADIEG